MVNSTCRVAGCDRPTKTKGYCNAHYARVVRHGSAGAAYIRQANPRTTIRANGQRGLPMPLRFWAKADVRDPADCWNWQASLDVHLHYGVFSLDGRQHRAHRVAYELVKGPIPEGLEVDHVCRNKLCVNPAHLEPVTHAENMRRTRRV